MTTGLTYSQYKTQIATLAVVAEDDPAFVTILPQMITYAENRIYRDLDFLFTSIATTAYGLTIGSRSITVPGDVLVVPEQINLITPAGTENPDLGTRVPLLPTTKEFLDAVYGNSQGVGQPKYFVPFDDYTFLVGPYPDQSYTCEIVGTYRPDSLSPTSTAPGLTTPQPGTTFISLYLPDLFIMASMIYVSGYQRNFGRANDDPQMAITYESQYQALLKGAVGEESRKKFEAAAWSSQGQSTNATPTRG